MTAWLRARESGAGPEVVDQVKDKYLCFILGGKQFAVNILRVKELVEYMDVTPLPKMPACYYGTINLRGRVVPIVDLSERLGQGGSEIARRSCFVIVEVLVNGQQIDVGIIVDAVNKVADISLDDRSPSPDFGGNIRNEYISDIGKVAEDFVVILNIDKVLAMDDLGRLDAGSPGPDAPEMAGLQPEVNV